MDARLPDARLPDWPERMAAAIQAVRAGGPGWGRADCGALGCAVAAAIGRDDLVPPAHAIARHSLASALRALDAIGGMAGWLSARCPTRSRPGDARRGDFMVMPCAHGRHGVEALAVVDADRVWTMDPQTGLSAVTLAEAAAVPGVLVFDTAVRLQEAPTGG
jgi:hypothetical protein